MSVREYTNKIYDALDEGLLSYDAVVTACLKYMSEAEVEDMCARNEWFMGDDNE